MRREKQIEELFKDLSDTPTGGVNEDFTVGTLKESHTDLFIRTVAGHLVSLNYRKQIEGEWETIQHNPRGEMLNVYSHICKVEGCGYFYKDIRPYGHKFCPNCGAKMKGV